ncbi:hydroxyacid dehydrogenase [Ponticoccus alexandrii]|uniref:Hydroxyacid dehydrogenase n=1 Tax=Ponticoccus alexandrii TaxID=1943633 RepID=A0ABX7FF92_9RHOB|nr:hydroxyacid dehydrogenase [Ponticoccus alexandrii]ETA53144.1 hypothetical protein P279_04540 [Rhodobacteraceae bacterium PD-2]QRF68786.1 hydroxyacid dehydrogenase [Ponticoccus alexandrii]
MRIVATSPLHPEAEELLRQTHDYVAAPDPRPETLRDWIGEADGIIVRSKLPPNIFDAAPRLKACVRHGVGLDFIPVDAATAKGIPVANLLEANRQGVVEYVVGAALSLARDFTGLDRRLRRDGWQARDSYHGVELAGRTLGVVGCGRIGRGVADAMRAAFGMRVIGYDTAPPRPVDTIEQVSLSAVFEQADVITLHLPSTAETRDLIGADLLSRMRPGALLVNAARGDLVDEAALVAGLAQGRPAAAAIDVFRTEPPEADHPFLTEPNLLLTPHIAGGTQESLLRMSLQSVEAMQKILQGQRPDSLVNPSVWDQHLTRLGAET